MRGTLQPNSMRGYTLPRYEYRTPPEFLEKQSFLYPVIVAGAGLAGLTAALELGTRGIRCLLLDEDDTVGASGLSSRGICYAKRSLEILDRFGVAARIREKGATWNEGDVYRGAERLYRFNLQPETDQKFPAFVNLQQFYVEQYLVERLQSVPAVDLRWKNRVAGIQAEKDFVAVKVETPDGICNASASYLVAADGGHSTVRELLGAEDEERSFYEDRWCIADVRMDIDEKRRSEQAVRRAYLDGVPTEGGAIWYHQMADGIWRTDWQIGHLADPDGETTPEKAVERLRKLVGPDMRFELRRLCGAHRRHGPRSARARAGAPDDCARRAGRRLPDSTDSDRVCQNLNQGQTTFSLGGKRGLSLFLVCSAFHREALSPPAQHPAREVRDLPEPGLPQHHRRLRRARAGAADGHDWLFFFYFINLFC